MAVKFVVESSGRNNVREFISKNIKSIGDQGFAQVLRDIIFNNDIDWSKVPASIEKWMPEETNRKQEGKSKTEGRLNDPQQWRHAALVNNDDDYFIVGSMGGKRFNDAQADEYWDTESSSYLFTDGRKTIRIGGFYEPNADESYTVIRDNDGRYSEIMYNARWIPEDHRKYPTYFFD